MKKDRVLAVIAMLEEVHKSKRNFDWESWGHIEDKELFFTNLNKGKKMAECATPACVAGWAVTHPWFRRRGLKGEFDFEGGSSLFPHYKNETSSAAMLLFLGMSEDERQKTRDIPINSDGEYLKDWNDSYYETAISWFDGPHWLDAKQVANIMRQTLKHRFEVSWWNEKFDFGDKGWKS